MQFMSPGVYPREIDLSTTIPAVSTNISVAVIRQAWKGEEYVQHFVSNDSQLTNITGKPTNKSFTDILSASGFLKYGNMLYFNIVRPEDATFSGVKIGTDYFDTPSEFTDSYTYSVSGEVTGTDDDYTYVALGTKDLKEFPTMVTGDIDKPLWIISNWRGKSSRRLRTLVINKDIFDAIKYYDPDLETDGFDYPEGISPSVEAENAVMEMYADDIDVYNTIIDLDISIANEYQFAVIIQAQDQGVSAWETKEIFVVSTREDELDDSNSSMFVEDVINEQSDYIKIAINPSNVDEEVLFSTKEWATLTGGYDGEWGRHSSTSAGEAEAAEVINAFDMYSDPEEIDVNLFIESDKGETVQRRLITICQSIRKDCMTILDVPKGYVINNMGSEAIDLVKWRKVEFNPNTSYAATFANWIEVFDKWSKKYRWIPMSGHMAGIFANTDNVADAWWAPAGLNRAVLTGVRRLAWNPKQGERDLLYKNGLNPVCSFSGQGKVAWGQRTLLDKSSAFNRINVRRLFLVLSKAISKASKYFVFEQNDEVTWMLMTNMIEPFLRDVKGRRGIYDFRVVIDETNNTPERIDRNELWGDIYIQPTRSAEFIQLSFIATKTGANFEELIGAAG